MLTIDARMIDHSGIGTYIRHLVPLVIARLPEVRVCLIGNPERLGELADAFPGRTDIVPADARVYSLKEQWQLYRAIPRETKLFWSPHYNIPLLYSGKLLVTVHDVFHLAMRQFVGGAHKALYAKLMFQAVRRKANRIISVSDFTKAEFGKWVGDNAKLVTIHNGIDESWRNAGKGVDGTEPYFLYVGNVKPHKNVSVLIRAFRGLADSIPHRLVIVGKKEGFLTGDEQAEQGLEELSDRIAFTGYVDEERLRKYVAGATAFVFPSLYEGFGFPPLESMAAGTPAIVSSAGSLPEVCGDAALYFSAHDERELAEAMLRLTGDDELRAALTERGKFRAGGFEWRESADRTATLIREVIGA